MSKVWSILLWCTVLYSAPADTTLYYREWNPGRYYVPLPRDSVLPGPYVAVRYQAERPIEVRRFDEKGQLKLVVRSQYDQWGNTRVKHFYDGTGRLRKVLQFQVLPDTLRLLSQIMGPDFRPLEKNLLVSISYNPLGRETNYYIKSVSGKAIAHREIKYNEQGLKLEERLVDDLHSQLITLRRFHYDDRTGTVTVREYDGAGNLRSKIILARPIAEPLTN